jgi:hypothetical protein
VPQGTITTNHLIKIPPTCQNQNSTNSGTNFKYFWLSRIFLAPKEILKEIEDIKRAPFLEVNSIKNEHLFLAFKEFVDEGEASAIVLAIEKEAELLLLEERGKKRKGDRPKKKEGKGTGQNATKLSIFFIFVSMWDFLELVSWFCK